MKVSKTVASALMAGLVSVGGLCPAAAQVTSTSEAKGVALEEVVVTGSRVIKNGNESPSPVTVVSTEDIARVLPGSTLAESLTAMPVFAGSRSVGSNPTTTGSGSGGNGSANQLNLRNIGANRTLVLVDGLRVPPTTYNGLVDVDMIPQMLVQRVDTVTGGVSAVYGSDAVAGVVNYIINKNLNGITAQLSRGRSERNDADRFDAAVAAGTSLFGERGHVEASYEYRNDEGISRRSSRPWINQWGVAGAGTAASPYQLYSDVRQAGFPFGGLITSGNLTGRVFGDNGVTRAFVPGAATSSAALQIGGDGGYYDSSLIASLKSHQLFGRFDYDLTDNLHAYAQVGGNIKTNGNFQDYMRLQNVTMRSINPFLAASDRALMPANSTFRMSEFVASAPRLNGEAKSKQWVYTSGLSGKLFDYTWGANYTHSTANLYTVLTTNVNNQRLAAALDAVPDANGKTVCNITLTNAALGQGCIPLNIFGPNAATTNDALSYVLQPTHYSADTVMNDVSGHIEGAPFGTWAGPVNVALSAEWRSLSFKATSDGQPSDVVDCTGILLNCTAGGALWAFTMPSSPKVSQQVKEAAIEFDAPLLKELPAAKSLSLNGAARYTSYNTSGNYWTWKLGLDWHITDSLRIRGTRSRDIRAPTLYELYAPVNNVTVTALDLLTNTNPSVPSTDLSNPNLQAEIANTVTAGIVWNPTGNLSIALDGYDIKLGDAIVQASGATAAYQQECYASGGTSFWCTLQQRNASGVITRWYTKYLNFAEVDTYGADLEINYNSRLFDRPMQLRLLTAYQPHVLYIQPGVPTIDQGGVAFGAIGLAAGPSLRMTALARFQPLEHFTVDVMERWRNSLLIGDTTQVWVNNHMDSFATTSLTLTYDMDISAGRTEVFLNVQNLFDAHAPGGAYSGNGTRSGLRDGFALGDDVVGRYYMVGARVKF